MKNPQNITIALLAVTAVIMGSMLLSGYMASPNAAYADTPIKQGDYILGTGGYTTATDLLYVIDIAARRLNVYYANINTNALDAVDWVDLNKAFQE